MKENNINMDKSDNILDVIGGIIHDYNNINTVISGNLSLAKTCVELDHNVYEYLLAAEEGVQQARALSTLLLAHINVELVDGTVKNSMKKYDRKEN
jgi:hypothetical protein